VPITLGLIERLLKAYPKTVAGVKDSSGDWNNTQAMIDAFGKQGFDVFAGSEVFLLRNMRAGGVGCITAGANVNPHGIDQVYRNWRSPDADAKQASVDKVRQILQSQVSMIPALKSTIAHYADDPEWITVRPPLVELSLEQRAKLVSDLLAAGFNMPGLRPQ
jgi:4-hydroxy-tetrahydrodipicolinate synthase